MKTVKLAVLAIAAAAILTSCHTRIVHTFMFENLSACEVGNEKEVKNNKNEI